MNPAEALQTAVQQRDEAQGRVHQAIVQAFPVGTPVEFETMRGHDQSTVKGHDGEIVLVAGKTSEAVIRRHYDKLTRL